MGEVEGDPDEDAGRLPILRRHAALLDDVVVEEVLHAGLGDDAVDDLVAVTFLALFTGISEAGVDGVDGSPEYQWSREYANEGYIQTVAPLVDLNRDGSDRGLVQFSSNGGPLGLQSR